MSMMGPAPGIAAATMAAAKLGPIDTLLAGFNTNPYFIGLMMLMLNLGGRFLAMEVTKKQEAFFSHPVVRRGLIFVVLFIATRNLVTAFWLWIIIVLTLGYLFNENSAYCILGEGGVPGAACNATARAGPSPPKPTDQELSIYRLLGEKVKTWEAFETMAAAEAADEGAGGDSAGAGAAPAEPVVVKTGGGAVSGAATNEVNAADIGSDEQKKQIQKSTGGISRSTIAKVETKRKDKFYNAMMRQYGEQATATEISG